MGLILALEASAPGECSTATGRSGQFHMKATPGKSGKTKPRNSEDLLFAMR